VLRARDRPDRDFDLLWAGQGVSQVGDAVTRLALPLTAVLLLQASTLQVGGLESAAAASWLLLSLAAGAWADRLPRRLVLLGCDATRAVLLVSVPVAWALGWLHLTQLYVVAFLSGAATVLFAAGYTAYLPSLVPAERIARANARLQSTGEAANIAGTGVGGALVSLVTGPGALLVDAVSFALAAVATARIRHREPPAPPTERHLRREIAEGLRTTFGQPTLRALALFSGLANVSFSALTTVTLVLLARDLHLSGAVIGALYMVSGLGGLLGGLMATRVLDRIGLSRATWLPGLFTLPFALLQPMVGHGARLVPYAIGTLLVDAGVVTYNVAVATYLQTRVPRTMVGRTSSAIRMVSRGAIVLGGLAGGVLSAWLGLRGAMWLLAAVIALLPVAQALSPLRRFGDVA
jgi:predicted MFS family arabinose efflux permease